MIMDICIDQNIEEITLHFIFIAICFCLLFLSIFELIFGYKSYGGLGLGAF